jgi:glycosyltransferase involved in cell wall biosynthesis
MRVLIDTSYAVRAPRSGTAVYINCLAEKLEKLSGLKLVRVANTARRPPAGGGLGSARNLATDLRWMGVELPRLARRTRAQLIHHPLPAFAAVRGIAQVVTLHDLAFERLPDHFDAAFRTYSRLTHRAAALAAGAVICVSETTAADAREIWRIGPERIVVARHGPGQAVSNVRRSAPEHFLYVGDQEPRKDLTTLLEAYRRYRDETSQPLGLVLAGSAWGQGEGIRVEPAPSTQRLAELHSSAAALVHPSLYEGFGLTAVEAMRAGTPVLAARVPAVTEICAEAVLYAPAGDAQAFARAMLELAVDTGLREALSARGAEQAARYSWTACAQAHLDAYSLALERR